MKIFIAGARSITSIPTSVQQRMMNICQSGYEVLVGDCYGVDASVQTFYSKLGYKNVVVYAGNGKARNNIGHWYVHSVPVPTYLRGFDFYKQKDVAMANEADYGLMIWDGESRGTLNNIVTLIAQNKKVLVYLATQGTMAVIKDVDDLNAMIAHCPAKTQAMCSELLINA